MRNENLYGWVFTFNPYQQLWTAVKREYVGSLFSGEIKKEDSIRSTDINTLIEIIIKTGGEKDKIDKLVEPVKYYQGNKVKYID